MVTWMPAGGQSCGHHPVGSRAGSQAALCVCEGLVSHCSEQRPRRSWNSTLQKLRRSPRGGHGGVRLPAPRGAETCTARGFPRCTHVTRSRAKSQGWGGKRMVPGVTCPPAQLSDGCQPVCLEQPFRLPDLPQQVSRPPPMVQEKPWDGPLSDSLTQRTGPREDILRVGVGAPDALFPESVQLMCCSHHSVFSSVICSTQ